MAWPETPRRPRCELHRLVAALLPPGTTAVSVQLHAGYGTWRRRFEADPTRPSLSEFYRTRYEEAQATPVDHVIDTDGLDLLAVADRVAAAIGLSEK